MFISKRSLQAILLFFSCTFVHKAIAATGENCALPPDLQSELGTSYPGSTIVKLENLSEYDRQLFHKDHDGRCPGLVKIDFFGDGTPTWAIVLMRGGSAKPTVELVVAHKTHRTWKLTSIDKSEGPAAVVWKERAGSYRDIHGKKEIRATRPVIVFCQYEAWTILYSWTGAKVAKVWIRD